MRAAAKPGFWLVAKREWRWLLRDRVALILVFGVPLFGFVVLSAAFTHPVIRGLGVVVVDADRSEVSRAFVEQVAASPSLAIIERTGDLASAARTIRTGDAIAAVHIPANFERDLKAERRPQLVAFYYQQFLTATGVASSGLSDSLSAATKSAAVPPSFLTRQLQTLRGFVAKQVNNILRLRWSQTFVHDGPPHREGGEVSDGVNAALDAPWGRRWISHQAV